MEIAYGQNQNECTDAETVWQGFASRNGFFPGQNLHFTPKPFLAKFYANAASGGCCSLPAIRVATGKKKTLLVRKDQEPNRGLWKQAWERRGGMEMAASGLKEAEGASLREVEV